MFEAVMAPVEQVAILEPHADTRIAELALPDGAGRAIL